MSILDYADVLNVNIVTMYYPNQNTRFCAHFEYAEIRTGSAGLLSEHGNGETPQAAINDYLNKIKGKLLILNAMSKDLRREFTVPTQIEPLKEVTNV